MIDLAAAYAETHDHLVHLLLGVDARALETKVPASPAWSVQDVVAHVTGIARDVALGLVSPELDIIEAWRDPNRPQRGMP